MAKNTIQLFIFVNRMKVRGGVEDVPCLCTDDIH